jgi:sugar porter (SP) family MFS transporter
MQNSKVLVWSIVVALGGFLFGFDTAVISGAEKAIQQLWQLSAVEHGFTVSIALIGTVIGSMIGGIPADRYGRKQTLIWIAIAYLVSALGSAFATDWYVFLLFRFMGGLGVGASSVAAPMYISEIAPARSRGKLVGLFQFNIVFGILIAYFSNYFMQGIGDNDWRWMLGIQAFPALIFLGAIFTVPESPRWLILNKGLVEEAKKTIEIIDPETSTQTLQAILSSAKTVNENPKERLFSGKYKSSVMLAVVFAIFNQVSGINAIIYYSPRIFEMTGLGTKAAFLSSAGIGLVNFLFTLLAINFIDRFGRRLLMLIGSVGLIITLALVARAFFIEDFSGVPIFLFVYIAFFAFSQGAVIWVFISEIFPNEVRANGQALGSFTHWIMAAIIAFSFPIIAERFGGGITFSFFCVTMILQLIFVWKVMPETKGTSLEQIEKTMIMH